MGLGKTLQSLCIVAGDHHHRAIKYEVSFTCTVTLYLLVLFAGDRSRGCGATPLSGGVPTHSNWTLVL